MCAPKLSWVLNGSRTTVSGLCRSSASISGLGMPSGTLRSPSISSLNATSRVAQWSPVSARNAFRTMVVRATSPNVPMCGRPDGP